MAEFVLAVDLGGTKVEAALIAADGSVLAGSRQRAPTGPGVSTAGLAASVDFVARRALGSLPDRSRLAGVGIGAAGPVDVQSGTTTPLNLRVLDFPIVQVVAAVADQDIPVRLALDGLCIALAESRFGAAMGAEASVSMIVSTGVGGGIIVGGRPLLGARGNAGHIDQLRVSMDRREDARSGTLEATASGPASVAWARSQGWGGASGEELAVDADPVAPAAIVRSATAVGHALAGLSAVLDIELFVIGGGFSNAALDYVALVESAVHELALLPASHAVQVRRAALAADAPLVGAACLIGWNGE